MLSHLKYPAIIGHDIAGEVVEVGSSVSNFKIGDCVAGFSLGTDKEVNDNAEGGFQEYVVLQPRCTFLIPDGISFERACEIPLGLLTSIGGLFESHQLGLQLPASPAQPSTKQAVVIWGGSTSVGCNAIQLAIAAGYDVFATSTPRNFELMRRLGAKQFFDYNSSSVASEMLSAIGSTPLAGALAIGVGGAEQCMTILSLAPVVVKKHVALATVPASGAEPRWFDTFRTIAGVLSWLVAYEIRGLYLGVGSAFCRPRLLRVRGGDMFLRSSWARPSARGLLFLRLIHRLLVMAKGWGRSRRRLRCCGKESVRRRSWSYSERWDDVYDD